MTMDVSELRNKLCNPPILGEKDQYRIKFADTPGEIRAAFKLRYEIFNLEQGKGLENAARDGIDRDEFDDYCLHLIVEEKTQHKIVGTYRIHLGAVASKALGFYSEQEFKITGLDKIAEDAIEVGRSCVSPEHRDGSVVALLWGGIAEIIYRSRLRYMFGCVSLEDTNPASGWAIYEHLKATGKISDCLFAEGLPKCAMPRPPQAEIDAILNDRTHLRELIPPLFKGYLRLGSKICGEPVFDHEFGTIDFLILLDVNGLPERYLKHFNVANLGGR